MFPHPPRFPFFHFSAYSFLAYLPNSSLTDAVLLHRQSGIIFLMSVLKGKANKVDALSHEEWKPARPIWEASWGVRRSENRQGQPIRGLARKMRKAKRNSSVLGSCFACLLSSCLTETESSPRSPRRRTPSHCARTAASPAYLAARGQRAALSRSFL